MCSLLILAVLMVGKVKWRSGCSHFLSIGESPRKIAGKSQCHRQFAATLRTAEHQRMGQTVLLNHLHKTVPYFLLTYNFISLHLKQYFCYLLDAVYSRYGEEVNIVVTMFEEILHLSGSPLDT